MRKLASNEVSGKPDEGPNAIGEGSERPLPTLVFDRYVSRRQPEKDLKMDFTSSIPGSAPFNHVGVGVDDVDEAIRWYAEVLGYSLIAGPFTVDIHAPGFVQAQNVLGPRLQKMRQAHMTTPNGVGIEFFQLIDPPHERRETKIEFWKNGFFHICVTSSNVEGLVRRIADTGGEQLSEIWNERPDGPRYQMCYCLDPFGNVIEVYSHSYELMQGHRSSGLPMS